MAARRLRRELEQLKNNTNPIEYLRDLTVDEANLFYWRFQILPSIEPFNDYAFTVEMKIPRN